MSPSRTRPRSRGAAPPAGSRALPRTAGSHALPRTAVLAALLALAPLAGATPAQAQGLSLNEAREMLNAESADEVRMGIEALGTIGSARIVEPLAERIRRGLPAPLLDLAIETLGLTGRREAGPILFELARHRRATARQRALEALVSCRPRGASRALVQALSDADPRVRATAALGLGQLEAADAVDPLFHAFDRGVNEASTSLGQLVDADGVERLLGFLGQRPLNSLTPALDEVLARDDMATNVKLEVDGRLAELATPEVRTYLEGLAEALPPGPLADAAEQAALRIVQ